MRCTACGRLPNEECCARCHAAATPRSHVSGKRLRRVETAPERVNLRRLRWTAGFTQAELAGFLGVATQTFSNWERGTEMPTPEHLEDWRQLIEQFTGE